MDQANQLGTRPALVGSATPVEEAFDPSKHTIDEVLDHVDGDPETAFLIASLEAAGKARSTLLARLDEIIEPD